MRSGRREFRFDAGNATYCESLEHGRLLSHGWSSAGPTLAAPDALRDVPADSFRLCIDGQDVKRGWRCRDEDASTDGHRSLTLAHDAFPLVVTVLTEDDGTGFLVRKLRIRNDGNEPLGITSVSAWSGLLFRDLTPPKLDEGAPEFDIGRFLYRAWATEGRFAWEPLPFGTLELAGMRGVSGWGPPFFIIRRRGTREHLVGYVAWSGTWSVAFTYDPFPRFGMLSFRAGPAGPSPVRVLSPGEEAESPAVHLGLMQGELDDIVHAAHTHVRRSVLPDRGKRAFPPISYNSWGGMHADVAETKLLAEVEKAHILGAELFVIDAGWFGRVKNNYPASAGDWRPGDWLANGLEPVADRVHAFGMGLGLWVALDMIGSRSSVFEQHPEWAVRLEGRTYFADIHEEGHPGFLMTLDLAIPEAAEWIESEVGSLIARYGVDLLRLDGAPTCYEGGYRRRGGKWENQTWRHVENYSRVLDRLRDRFPGLWIDNCCGGAGRLDLAMMARCQIAWPSDDYHSSELQIQCLNGLSLSLPPELLTRTFGTILRTVDDLNFALRVPLFGQYCLSGMKDHWLDSSSTEGEQLHRHLDIYRRFIRPIMPGGKIFHHTPVLVGPDRSAWCVLEYGSADGNRAAIGVFRLGEQGDRRIRIRPRGLNADRRYHVVTDNDRHEWSEDARSLFDAGLSVQLPEETESELILLSAEDDAKR